MLTKFNLLQFSKIAKILNTTVSCLKKPLINSFKVDFDNACFNYEFSDLVGHDHLHTCAFEYIQRWFSALVKSGKHLDLRFDLFSKLLSSQGLNITCELEVSDSADAWMKYDASRRSRFAKDLIKKVRLPLLSSAALNTLLNDTTTFSKCPHSQQYIRKAICNSKDRTLDPASIDCRNRYCAQQNFDIIISGEMHGDWKRFYVHKHEENDYESVVELAHMYEFVKQKTVELVNGVFYFLNSSNIYSYSLFTESWDRISFPEDIDGWVQFSSCSFMSEIYIVGGHKLWGNVENSCYVFNPKSRSFKQLANLKYKRYNPGCSVFSGKIVVSGGSGQKTVEAYDHSSNEWSDMPDMINERSGHASVSIRDKIYMIDDSSCHRLEVFDGFSRVFVSILPSINFDISNLSNANTVYKSFQNQVVTIGDKIILLRNGGGALVFDLDNEAWSRDEDYERFVIRASDYLCVKCPMF